jgi:hypothetical protein
VAWDGDGHCLAATGGGLAFWEGTSWNNAPARGISDAEQIRFVHRVRPGQWLVGGDRATFGSYSSSGAADVVHGPDPNVAFTHASGDFEDLAVMVAQTTAGKWILYAISSRRWLRPFPLDDVAAVSALARIHDERWLICGRLKQGGGFAWLYEPLAWRTWPLEVPSTRAFLGCAAHAERGLGVAVGTDGNVIWIENDKVRHERIAEAGDLSAAALDVSGRGWCAAAGRLYLRSLGADAAWTRVWTQAEWSVPIVSLFADVGIVVAVSADGGVLEGRAVAEVVKQIDASR